MGELGIIAMVQGPGPHLKIPKSLCGGVVKPEESLGGVGSVKGLGRGGLGGGVF